MNLDLKDKKILYQLDNDARQPCSKIGKKVGLSSEVVNYRIKRLEQQGIITHYQLIVNLALLDIIQFKLCLSFQHLDSAKLDEFISILKKKKEAKWIVSCKGNWDLIISLETHSLQGVESIKNEILALFGTYVNQKSISLLVEAETYNRDYLIKGTTPIDRTRTIMKKQKTINLDNLDLELIKQLSNNARTPITQLAKTLNTTTRIVNYKLKQLIKQKAILGSKIAINYEKLGIQFYKTFIAIDQPLPERMRTLHQYLRQHPNCTHHVQVLSNWDLEPEFEVHSEQAFDTILKNLKDEFSDVIKHIQIITISKEHKFVYF